MSGRNLPWHQEAEESVVGGILLYPKAFRIAAAEVRAADFFHPTHEAIFAAMGKVAGAGQIVDAISVAEQMRADDSHGKLRAFGGEGYFVELMSKVVTVENIAFHAKIVAGKAKARGIIEEAEKIAARGRAEYGDVDEYASESLRDLGRVARGREASGLTAQGDSILSAVRDVEAAQAARASGAPSPAMTTGFRDLDAAMDGGWRREYVVIGARPSMGKTSLMMDMAEAAARWGDAAVLVVTLETEHKKLAMRRIAAATGIAFDRLRSGDLGAQDHIRLSKEANGLYSLPIWYYDGSRQLGRIVSTARGWAEEQGQSRKRRLIVTDYIGLIQGGDDGSRRSKFDNREREVAEVSSALAGLRADCDATVIALSQLSRRLEERPDKRPLLSDLRESGSIEQDADAVMFLYRDAYYSREADPNLAEVIVAKQRDGRVGTVHLGWDAPRTRFYDLPEGFEPPAPPSSTRKRRGGGNPHAVGGED